MRNFGITVAGIHFTTWLYFGIARRSQLLNAIFSSRILVYIGKISYSLYVYHWFLLILLLPRINQFLLASFQVRSSFPGFMLCLLITFIVSMLSYKYFEKPIIKIKRKFSYR
jgi:peptidoglycan/LPS O-acetylase OafA/YrhL